MENKLEWFLIVLINIIVLSIVIDVYTTETWEEFAIRNKCEEQSKEIEYVEIAIPSMKAVKLEEKTTIKYICNDGSLYIRER